MRAATPHSGVSDPPFPDREAATVLVPGCARCPELAGCRDRIAWGNGPSNADVVVVGEAPAAGRAPPDDGDVEAPATADEAVGDPATADEAAGDPWRGGNRTGLAYTSRHSGRRIRSLFADLGYDPYYTNAVKCFPADSEDPATNREPTTVERRRCAAHLRTEIDAVDPAVVVTTGRHATEAVLNFEDRTLDGFLDAVLEPTECPTLGVTLVPVLHPSYQDVWLSRLGYDAETYRRELAALLP
jgi:uracil-DNA glycosylase family 4